MKVSTARRLIWGGFWLVFALMFAGAFLDSVRDARRPVPTLSPDSVTKLHFEQYRARLVDVVGFTLDCESTIVDGERWLTPGSATEGLARIFVAFDDADDCREAVARGDRLRANVEALPHELRAKLEFGPEGPELAFLVEPHEIDYWSILGIIIFGGIAASFFYLAALDSREAPIPEPLAPPPIQPVVRGEAPKTDDRCPTDPYRTGKSARLITETLAPAPSFMNRLKLRRRISIAAGIPCIVGALAWSISSGQATAQLILGPGSLFVIGVGLVISGFVDRQLRQLAAVFEDTREALLELVRSERQIVDDRETGAIIQHFRIRDSERSWSHFVAVGEPGPLFLDDERKLALALYHPRNPDYLLVLSEDLRELDRPPFSAARLRARFEAQSGRSES